MPHFVSVTHPFHPYAGRRGVFVVARYNRYGKRLLVRFDDGVVCSVPEQWTDLCAPDPEVMLAAERSVMRVVDFIALADLVVLLSSSRPPPAVRRCKVNSAASVKQKTPPRRLNEASL